MKTSLVAFLSLLLGVALTVTILSALGVNFNPHDIEIPMSCNDNERYGEIDDEVAAENIDDKSINRLSNMYYDRMFREHTTIQEECFGPNPPDDCPRKGAFISKRVIDAVLGADQSANGLLCRFVWDEESDKMGVAVEPARQRSVEVIENADNPRYLIKSYCPPTCDYISPTQSSDQHAQ